MKSLALAFLVTGLAAGCDARAVGSLAEVSIIDRDSGSTLPLHYSRGEYWIAGRPGGRYAIEVHNRLGERLLAVTSVDGVNILSGETAGWDQAGYVFSPSERYQITGWRKSDAEVAAFTFTASPNSYAERTGRPANVGVIGVALFRERRPVVNYVPPMYEAPAPSALAGASEDRAQAQSSLSTPEYLGGKMQRAPQFASAPMEKLGTGHGEREASYVGHTDFIRLQSQPNEVIRIRYDSVDNLIAMGIIPRPRSSWSGVDPFPASPERGYVPDPPG